MAHNKHSTASNPINSSQARLNNAGRDQRRWGAISNAVGKAKTRPSRSMTSRDTIGGTVFASARNSISQAQDIHPWKVTISKTEGGTYKAFAGDGILFKNIYTLNKATVTQEEENEVVVGATVVEGDLVCIKYEDELNTYTIAAEPSEDFEPFVFDAYDDLVASFFPLAKIVAVPDSDPVALTVEQYVRSNLKGVTLCYNGRAVDYYLAV